MKEILKLLGIEYTIWKATDGSNLLSEDLYKNISFLPGYEDPYYKRPMKTGEVGFYFVISLFFYNKFFFILISSHIFIPSSHVDNLPYIIYTRIYNIIMAPAGEERWSL